MSEEKRRGNPHWTKGQESPNPNGRPVGSKNKATQKIRVAYQKLTEENLENMTVWLNQIAADNPKEAMEMMLKLSEYVLPKLQRQEITGADGEDLFQNIRFEFGPSVNSQDRDQTIVGGPLDIDDLE